MGTGGDDSLCLQYMPTTTTVEPSTTPTTPTTSATTTTPTTSVTTTTPTTSASTTSTATTSVTTEPSPTTAEPTTTTVEPTTTRETFGICDREDLGTLTFFDQGTAERGDMVQAKVIQTSDEMMGTLTGLR